MLKVTEERILSVTDPDPLHCEKNLVERWEPLWLGPLCEQRACQRPELYGPQCSLICRCHPDNTDM